jgi:hypothetical protein
LGLSGTTNDGAKSENERIPKLWELIIDLIWLKPTPRRMLSAHVAKDLGACYRYLIRNQISFHIVVKITDCTLSRSGKLTNKYMVTGGAIMDQKNEVFIQETLKKAHQRMHRYS